MLKKDYTKTGRSCRVTFEMPAGVDAQKVALCGEFNNWNATAHPLKQRRDGRFSVTLSLKPGQAYRFRYLVDGRRWENDWSADSYVPNGYGDDDSVVVV